MNSKEELSNNIFNLKNEIQALIDLKKNNDNLSKEEIYNIDLKKTQLLQDISNYSTSLKELIKKEKQKTTLLNTLKKAQNVNDSINYHFAKKYNNSEELENLKKNKEVRENVRQEYLHYIELQQIFEKLDPINVPGFLFLHQNIIDKYGLCPFILPEINLTELNDNLKNNLNDNLNEISEKLEKDRNNWLNKTFDKGNSYFELKKEIYDENELQKLQNNLLHIESNIINTINTYLNNSQIDIYEKTINLIKEYINSTIKTKKLKEKYKLILHNLSILFNEKKLVIHKFLETKYNLNLPINEFVQNENFESKNNDLLIIKNFEELVFDYKTQLDIINQKIKYLTNIKKNLKQEFHDFLMNKSTTKFVDKKNIPIIQEGKYFKNWSELTIDEKNERIKSFSSYYVQKFMTSFENSEELTTKLVDLLQEQLKNKKLTCKDLNWKMKKGVIENIKILKFNDETSSFYLEKIAPTIPSNSLQKSLSKRSLFNKSNEKIINEEMLKFILQYKESNSNTISNQLTDYIEEFLDKLKFKLKLKKISKDDKSQLTTKLIDMNNIIQNNPIHQPY